MLALRQQSRGLARLAQLLQPQLPLVCTAVQQAAWAQQPVAALHGSAAAAALGGGGGITGWLTSKVSGLMGAGDVEDLDLNTFGEQIKKARMLGGLTGYAYGTGAARDSAAQGTMRLFGQIIDAMTPEEKKNLQLFDAEARARVAQQVKCTTSQVDDCIARYLWTRQLTQLIAQRKRDGKPPITDIHELESTLGTWRQYKTQHENADGSAALAVPLDHTGPKGQPCGLAGQPVGKNTKCPVTKKAFKACCGRTLKLG